MKNIKFTGLFLFYLAILFSCSKTVEYEIAAEPRPVLNCFFSPDNDWKIQLSETKNTDEQIKFEPVFDAVIKISKEGVAYSEVQHYIFPVIDTNALSNAQDLDVGFYQLKPAPLSKNDLYTINVIHPDLGTLAASCKMPAKANYEIVYSTILVDSTTFNNGYKIQGNIELVLSDNDENSNYFALLCKGFADSEIHGLGPVYLRENNVNFELNGLEENPIPSYGNQFGFLFSDTHFQTNSVNLFLNLDDVLFLRENDFNKEIYLELWSLSEDMYLYLTTYFRQILSEQDPYSQPNGVYNNIENGLGVFAAYNPQRDTIKL